MRRYLTATLVGMLALSAAAAHESGDYEPVLTNERVYFHCGGTMKVSNVEGGAPFGWDTTAPTGSVQDGSGCGTLDVVLSSGPETGETAVFEGTFTGNLDELTLELYMIDVGFVRAGEFDEVYADLSISIDDFAAGWMGEARLPVERANSDVTAKLEVTVAGIDLVHEDEAGEHTIRIELQTADYYNGDSGAWVWDTIEVPAGITFNPTTDQRSEYVVVSF